MGADGAAYLRALLAADTEGLRVIFEHTPPVELVSDLAAVALTVAGLAFGDPAQVDLWLAAQLNSRFRAEASHGPPA